MKGTSQTTPFQKVSQDATVAATPATAVPGPADLLDSIIPEQVVAEREGSVLLRHTILKSDHFPGCQNTKLVPLLEGAPNFRQVPDLPVYGVAIPTVAGVRLVLDTLGAWKGRRKVLWHNMREEPVIYINGKPYVVREADKPFANLEYTGIDGVRVEDMEARLKQDVLIEAEKYNGMIMVAHEDDEFQVIEAWEPVSEEDVQTPAEVYEELAKDGYDVDYLRVPVTDEKAPGHDDFEILMSRCWAPPEGSALVFNCQMGRGRTTTGMAIGSILHLRRLKPSLKPPVKPEENLPSWFINQQAASAEDLQQGTLEESELKAGRFSVVRSLLRALEHGKEAKAALDAVLDACSAMQNLREAIASYRNRIYYEANDARKQSLLQVCLEYLERYYVLISFTAYLCDPAFNPETAAHISFDEWTKSRPELQGILLRLLRTNPLAALGLDHAPDAAVAGVVEEKTTEEQEMHADLIARRDGSVLGPHTILKQDHFPGCQSTRLPSIIAGAPNFRQVPGLNVFGGAIPTVEGVKKVLDLVGAGPNSTVGEGNSMTKAVWHIMREEPVVYINGAPYVLREDTRPFKNLLEYRGIDASRLGQMEQRLKEDLIKEGDKFGGKILVTREAATSGPRNLKDEFVELQGPSPVQTLKQVFRELEDEGYRVQLVRVPLTDGTCPRPTDFDAFYASVAAAAPTDALIYTCQLGGGRTTMGMAIGVLLRLYLNGATLPAATLLERSATLAHMDEDVNGGSPRRQDFDDEKTEYRQQMTELAITNAAMDLESKNLLDGEYVGVRRFVRTLESGVEAKQTVDAVVDACAVLINLRTSIMRYRKPKSAAIFFTPEIQSRHLAFQRGSAYLERYCMLIAFSVYLHQCRQRGRQLTFDQWLLARPDITQARDAIHLNPAGALAPLPPILVSTPAPGVAATPVPYTSTKEVPLDEQRQVLVKRRGSTVGRRSILKSFYVAPRPALLSMSDLNLGKTGVATLEGVSEVRTAEGWPVLTLGNCTVNGIRRLLDALHAGPGGSTHVVLTDLREELVLYVNGLAYLRRELEMPAAALHHAGIQAAKLEDLERRLRADMMAESGAWGGKILLHREINSPSLLIKEPSAAHSTDENEDITRTTDFQPTHRVQAFWESAGSTGDIDQGMCTPNEVFTGIAAEGYHMSYRRVPMSRERTPQPVDLDQLHLQMEGHPGTGKKVAFIFISRTATGSSARFAATFACECLAAFDAQAKQFPIAASPRSSVLSPRAFPMHPWNLQQQGSAEFTVGSPDGLISPSLKRIRSLCGSSAAAGLLRQDSEASDMARSVQLGEYRGILNLCRLLPGGAEAKAAVDEAIHATLAVGNIIEDIHKCKELAEDEESNAADSAAARRLGLHYLKRYFFLIAFKGYLDSYAILGRPAPLAGFTEWMSLRKELTYLLSTLGLE